MSVLLALLGAGPALAQDRERPPAIGGDGSAVPPPSALLPRAEDVSPEARPAPPPIEEPSLLDDMRRLAARAPGDETAAILDGLMPEEDSPGSVSRSYRGVQAIVVRRLRGYFRRFANDDFEGRWRGRSLTVFQFEALGAKLEEAEWKLAHGGDFADRTWRQSLVPERGGAPLELRIDRIGEEIELLRIGELVFTNEGKLRLGRLSVYLDDDRIYEKLPRTREPLSATPKAKNDAKLARGPATAEKAAPAFSGEENRIDLSVGLGEDDAALELDRVLRGTLRERLHHASPGKSRRGTPRGNLLTGDGWHVSTRPSLQLRLPSSPRGDPEEAVSSAGLQVDLALFTRDSREPWGMVSFKVRGRPNESETILSLEFVFLRW